MKEFKLILLFLVNISLVQAQSLNEPTEVQLGYNDLKENIILISDKTLYTTNEVLNYKASYLCSRNLEGRQWSRVLYVELVDENGSPVVQDKIELDLNGAANKMRIPGNINSGVYYIKAYTQWMRNDFVDNYGLAQIVVVNPNNSIPTDIHTNSQAETAESESLVKNSFVALNLADELFTIRDTVNLELVYNKDYIKNYDHCITVVKKGMLLQNEIELKEHSAIEKNDIQYFPDFYGLNLSGKLVYRDSQQAYKNGTVYISALSNSSFMGGSNTNKNGEFLFSLPYAYNETDFYLSTDVQNHDLDIKTNRGFCTESIAFERSSFNFDKSVINELLINQQLNERFKLDKAVLNNTHIALEKTFYGSPKQTFHTGDFVDLPNLEEFFFEIVTDVTVFYHDKKPAIRAASWNAFSNSPFLLMVDNIPILDIHKFLEIKTSLVDKIEIVNQSYVLGNLKYAGIINVFSKQNNLAGMELPRNYSFISYEMLKPNSKVIDSKTNVNANTPDLRNCLYWNPWLNPQFNSTLNLSFTTSDLTGEFEIIVYSISKLDGEKQMNKVHFVVK